MTATPTQLVSLTAPLTVECPECGKHSIINPQDGLYQCLSCDFKKDVNRPPAESKDTAWGSVGMILGSLGLLAFLLLLL